MAKVATKKVSGGTVVIEFANGSSLIGDVMRLPQNIRDHLLVHGLAQKLGDSYAGAESVAEAQANAETVWEALMRGEWSSRATGGVLAEAISRALGKPIGEVVAALAKMEDKAKAAIRKHPDVLKALRDIEVERASGRTAPDLASMF